MRHDSGWHRLKRKNAAKCTKYLNMLHVRSFKKKHVQKQKSRLQSRMKFHRSRANVSQCQPPREMEIYFETKDMHSIHVKYNIEREMERRA